MKIKKANYHIPLFKKLFGTFYIENDLNLCRTFTWPFIIAKVSQPIIGGDFLEKFNLIVDPQNNSIIDAGTMLSSQEKMVHILPGNSAIGVLLSPFRLDKVLAEYPELINPSYVFSDSPNTKICHCIQTKRPLVFSKPCHLSQSYLQLLIRNFIILYLLFSLMIFKS